MKHSVKFQGGILDGKILKVDKLEPQISRPYHLLQTPFGGLGKPIQLIYSLTDVNGEKVYSFERLTP